MPKVHTHTPWLRRFHDSAPAVPRLICFPHAGGSASSYFEFSRLAGAAVDVVAVQYPGRQDRHHEPPLTSIDGLADAVVSAVGPLLDRPVALFGHSMGATVAFEVARRLEATGRRPSVLFVSGRRAASLQRQSALHLESDERLVAEVASLDGTHADVLRDPSLMRYVLPSLRADYRAIEQYHYVPTVPLRCDVVALTGDADPHVDIDEARKWRRHTVGRFDLVVHPGGHFYLQARAQAVVSDVFARIRPGASVTTP
ncbi:thioesterase II family protein [Rathayibacter tritici]|uniref:Oleoyl-ACP hydrolase n=1 Tax=Rathayibacter tritici TaxID=33888 RepID=A0A160KRJ3_9MICO|nr:alpha/beta fold hydrolase [Rathayibacter tritici]AND15924.1 oleoyl-ACP hydrolase [Rathayibacter tritici]PPI41075.1 thioesterase [Rathayibacter tritici]